MEDCTCSCNQQPTLNESYSKNLVPNLKFGRGPQRGELRRQLTKLRGKQSVLAISAEVDEAPFSAFPIIHMGSNNPRHTVTFALDAITSKGRGRVRSGRIAAAAANNVTRTVVIVGCYCSYD